MKERIERWKQMEAAGDPATTGYLKEITAQAKAEGKIQEMNDALNYLINSADSHLANIENALENTVCKSGSGLLRRR